MAMPNVVPAETAPAPPPWPPKPTPVTPDNPVDLQKPAVKIDDQAKRAENDAATPVTPVEESTSNPVREELTVALSRLQRTFVPPDIVREDRPSLQKVIAYAWRGDWGPEKGAWRVAGQVDAVIFAIPVVALLYALAWAWERPARRYAAFTLVTALAWWLNWL